VRDAFFATLAELAADNPRIWALTGDLGINLFDDVERVAPGRVLNVGIAEQNLVGVSAGLSYAGQVPFAYSIAPFVTSRPHDQVRVDVAMAKANVKLIGVGGGLAYGYLGPTHHAIEDLAITRALPNLTVLAPADPAEVRRATRAAFALDGPVYLRLGKNGEKDVLPADASFVLGRATHVRDGDDVTLVSTGAILGEVVAAAQLLAASGIESTILHCGTLKPFDAAAVVAAAGRTGAVVTVEEHSIVGGLGSATAEALAEAGTGARLRRVGVPDAFVFEVGSQEHLLAHLGLDASGIAATARALLHESRPSRSLT
jgi:transketolase